MLMIIFKDLCRVQTVYTTTFLQYLWMSSIYILELTKIFHIHALF